MIDKKLINKILDVILQTGGDFSEVFIQKRSLNNLRMEDRKIEKINSGFELGCGLRLIKDDSTFFAYIDSIEKEKIINAAKVLSAAISETKKIKILDLQEIKSPHGYKVTIPPSIISQGKKKEYIESIDMTAREYDHSIMQVTASLSDIEEEVYIANSEGVFSHEPITKVFLAVNVVAARGDNKRTGYKSIARTAGYEILQEKDLLNTATEAARIAVTMLDAVNAPVGKLPVVIGPAFGGVIFHEACGHGLEGDSIVKDSSVFKDKIGKSIASKNVTAIDDPTMQTHWGSYLFDGEGFPSQKNILISDGVLQEYIVDYRSSKQLKTAQTGNGRRQSYRDIPLPRMSNTYIEKGVTDPEDIIRSVEKGVYAREFAGGQVDPATGDFVFGISEGYIINKGMVSEPIKGATLIGNGPQVLKKIETVGNDLGFAPGFCGKGGQSIANEVGQPTILVGEMTVGGTEN